MTAIELANKLMDNLTNEYDCDDYMVMAAELLKQQSYELEQCKTIIALANIAWKNKFEKELGQ